MESPEKRAFHPSILHIHAHIILLFSMSILLGLQPAASLSVMANETDRLALLDFKARISGDPYVVLSSWNDSAHFCTWKGVACGHKHQRVISLSLHDLRLRGTISPHIGNLTFLRDLSLDNNKFHGEIPPEVGRLFRLRNLNLSVNMLEGKIPVNVSYCSELRSLDVYYNNLVGKIPLELHHLKKLVVLVLSLNSLTGDIPRFLGNISTLQNIFLARNNLHGSIPNEIGQLTSLTVFAVGINNLSGKIPLTLYNISSINAFSIAENHFNDSVPENIGFTLSKLQKFGIGGNQFHGTIPISLFNASQLQIVDVAKNFFMGPVSSNLCGLNSLEFLNLEHNMLGDNRTGDLTFVECLSNCSKLERVAFDDNNFGGELPRSIGNLSTELVRLYVGFNHISGRIPAEIGNLVNLIGLGLERNYFSGSIPISFRKLVNLQLLGLSENLLCGEIPPFFGNLTQLFKLEIYANKLEGKIPSSIGSLQNLNILDISHNKMIGTIPPQVLSISSLSKNLNLSQNSFTGPLSLEVGKMININQLDMSENKLSGEIPMTLGDCLALEILHMQGNLFQGHIPSSFASLRGLRYLDLSRNHLSGNIPKALERLFFLKYLNLSFNNLEGEVPTKGVFSNASAISLVGNTNLCGGIPELQLRACPVGRKKKSRRSTMDIILATTISSVVLFMMVLSSFFFYRRKSRQNSSSMPSIVESLPRISYQELLQSTRGFSSDNLIGQGSIGSVYRGNLDRQGERLVAVKVLNLQQQGAVKSFISECKALKNIRHRNLIKLLTYCSSIDFKGNDFKALVYDFMANGSLDTWLHPGEDSSQQSRHLSLVQRLMIAVDVSSALHYLHDNCETSIIHCDLKPSNILLDRDMTAHVGDFGLAKLLSPKSSQGQTSSIGVKGTIGYMAPEYGIGSQVTTYGDVYSFGIILLEIFTGRRPTDERFTNDVNIHNFVRANLSRRIMQVMDPVLITAGELEASRDDAMDSDNNDNEAEIQENNGNRRNFTQGGGNARNCLASVLTIGLACSSEVPRDRMNMRDVTRKLNIIMKTFLQARTRRDHQIVAH